MDYKSNTVRLYSVQSNQLITLIDKEDICFSKKEFINSKYGESAPIFITAYTWLAGQAPKYVPKPQKAELHYWAFANKNDFEKSVGSSVLILDIPVNECLFFNVYDWNKILKLQYIGKNKGEEKEFRSLIKDYGIKHDSDIMLTNFYPDFKRQITESWQNLFRYHKAVKEGNSPLSSIQAALWQIKKQWISDIIK